MEQEVRKEKKKSYTVSYPLGHHIPAYGEAGDRNWKCKLENGNWKWEWKWKQKMHQSLVL